MGESSEVDMRRVILNTARDRKTLQGTVLMTGILTVWLPNRTPSDHSGPYWTCESVYCYLRI